MRLTKAMRKQIVQKLIEQVRIPRNVAFRQQEQALAVKLLRHRYGDDVFEKCRALPEGWLRPIKILNMDVTVESVMCLLELGDHYHSWRKKRSLQLLEYTPLPYNAEWAWKAETVGPILCNEFYNLTKELRAFTEELELLEKQVTAVVESYTTVEKLQQDWPEGFAFLPQEMLAPKQEGLPAPRISDLNERIEAIKQVA